MIAEADLIMNKDNVDRSYYGSDRNDKPNAGGEFGIERAEFLYSFSPLFELESGWDIRYLDIQTGGLLYGDDHPFIGFRGKLPTESVGLSYEVLYLPIQNIAGDVGAGVDWDEGDWRVYTAKFNAKFGGENSQFTISPLLALSDNEAKHANVTYFGLEGIGKFGFIKPSFEIISAEGDFDEGAEGNADISALAFFAGVEFDVTKTFTPYVAYRYTSGDDNSSDNDVEGFVGITDIGRFTPLMGMDGNILGEHLASGASIYGASLYAYAPERAVGGAGYGGIGNGGSGNNPGQKLLAFGAKGDLSTIVKGLSYKAQTFLIWYDETANLVNIKDPGTEVDDYAGTTIDLQLKYKLDKNFTVDYIGSTFIPGDGIQDQVDADDNAYVNMLTLAWAY
jgi:hypothetical protein